MVFSLITVDTWRGSEEDPLDPLLMAKTLTLGTYSGAVGEILCDSGDEMGAGRKFHTTGDKQPSDAGLVEYLVGPLIDGLCQLFAMIDPYTYSSIYLAWAVFIVPRLSKGCLWKITYNLIAHL